MEKLSATYNHKEYEKKWWSYWTDGGFFRADAESEKEPYTVLIPPPNVTDRLHMGHGLNNTIQDILIRWKRMQGYNACWLPGTDHAGIATQMMVEKSLKSEGTDRKTLGRDAFFKRCVAWQQENGGIITEQLKRLGASCDWDREAYTLSPELSAAVRKMFVTLFEKGLIYKGERLVNWDPVLKTAISDDEIETKEVQGNLWYYRYPVVGSGEEFVTVATTRPETMLGDTAVAVHPDDERYKHLVGKKLRVPFVNREIPVIADDYVKSEFGTGCVKITPAHDPNDFEMGKRHSLPFINVMNEDASMNDECPEEFRGLDRYEARKKLIIRLKEEGLFEKTEQTTHAVPYSERGKAPVEPRLSMQWYVKMSELAKPAIAAAKSGELKFFPASWEKTYLHWLENIQDWCISRQLWWGHQIPVWYCDDCEGISSGLEDPSHCQHCNSPHIRQDTDVLDTWFSSWLWPLSPFGWPEETKDLKTFFPSAVLVTGPDIIYLWVARMIMAGYFTQDKLAFKDVYFNAIICDKEGRKFSKTLGNGIDPLPLIGRFGADAVRYTCVSLAPLGGRVRMAESDFDNGNRFINKLWNAARFLLSHVDEGETIAPLDMSKQDLPGKWLIQEFRESTRKILGYLETYHINEAVESIFHLAWRSFCDWGLECGKDILADKNDPRREQVLSGLVYVFEGIMRLAAPVIPFIAEEIWQKLPEHPSWNRPESLVIASYPELSDIPEAPGAASDWQLVQDIINGVRSVRTQAKVPPKEKPEVWVRCPGERGQLVKDSEAWIKKLAGVETVHTGADFSTPEKSLMSAGKGFSVYVPVGQWLDFDKEKKRLENELKRVQKIVAGLQGKLGNQKFLQNAPEDVVTQSKKQLENMQSQLEALKENLSSF